MAVATAVFVLLTALIILAHFRPDKGVEFTLINVAAAVHGSELPAQFAQIKAGQLTDANGPTDVGSEGELATDESDSALGKGKVHHIGYSPDEQQDIAEMLGGRRIFMQRGVDGSLVLHIS